MLVICFIFGDKPMLTIIITTLVVTRRVGRAMLNVVDISLPSIQGKAKIVNIYSPSPGLAEHSGSCKIHFEKVSKITPNVNCNNMFVKPFSLKSICRGFPSSESLDLGVGPPWYKTLLRNPLGFIQKARD